MAESPDAAARKPPLALIAGPTASGKSDLAVVLAEALAKSGRRGVVINADSSQVYADLSVLSARPTVEDMRGIEHRLYGVWDGAESCSAADWATRAKAEVAALQAEGAVPILVGGAGLYVRTLLDGIAPIPPIDPTVREAVRALPTAEAYGALCKEDPERAYMLSANDTTRVARALEVVRSTGRPLAAWQAERSGGIGTAIDLHPLVLQPDRDWLYRRCDRRFELMIARGAVAEVESLMARRLDPGLPVMRAIGVPEIAGMLEGCYSVTEMVKMGAQATRRYAKRQYTWFRHQPPAEWPRSYQNDCGILTHFEVLLRN